MVCSIQRSLFGGARFCAQVLCVLLRVAMQKLKRSVESTDDAMSRGSGSKASARTAGSQKLQKELKFDDGASKASSVGSKSSVSKLDRAAR